jgi:X-X-X-Leu-X-X-Gly heptad repeat protein
MFRSMTEAEWTWSAVIDVSGGTGEVADGLSQLKSTVSGWRERGIPGRHWLAIVTLAKAKGRPDVDLAVLARLAARVSAEVRA